MDLTTITTAYSALKNINEISAIVLNDKNDIWLCHQCKSKYFGPDFISQTCSETNFPRGAFKRG